MKKLMNVYENCRVALRITYLGFFFIAIGAFIQNKNVNIFYTFSSPIILTLAEGFLKLGETIIYNLPIIFMVNYVCKKSNSGTPIIYGFIGYFTYLIVMSLFADQTLPIQAYFTGLSDIFSLNVAKYPFNTGIIGAFIVAIATKFAFIHSRHRGSASLLGFLNQDTAGVIYNIVYCGAAGFLLAYLYPIGYSLLQTAIDYISTNISDPVRLGAYGLLDRTLSLFGMGDVIRYPFWFTSAGGSYSSLLTGQVINGDVNIWDFVLDASSTYAGAGRFITPYYAINMFVIPSIYLCMWLSMTNKKDKQTHLIPMIGIALLSFIMGNPLPAELYMLFTAPLLLFMYIVVVGILFAVLSKYGYFLGFFTTASNISTSMPGSFPDYIINLRNIRIYDSLVGIAKVGLIAAVVMGLLTIAYYKYFAYDFARTGKKEDLASKIIRACGGEENIKIATNSVLRIYVDLNDLEQVSYARLQELKAKRVVETKTGIGIEFGTSSKVIARTINKQIKHK